MRRYSPATANKRLAALRGALREAFRLGLMTAEDYHSAVDLPGVKGSPLPRGRALSFSEVKALFTACADESPAGARDAALLAVLYGAGLRRSEAVSLTLADFDPEARALKVQKGKGGKGRVVHIPYGTRDALNAWLSIRGSDPGPLFRPVRKGGALEHRPMTTTAVYLALARRAERAGIAAFSPHDLRRSYISELIDRGADLPSVQVLAGHANVTTTAGYDRRRDEARRKAADLMHVPYPPPVAAPREKRRQPSPWSIVRGGQR